MDYCPESILCNGWLYDISADLIIEARSGADLYREFEPGAP